jgi:hypothetical protein
LNEPVKPTLVHCVLATLRFMPIRSGTVHRSVTLIDELHGALAPTVSDWLLIFVLLPLFRLPPKLIEPVKWALFQLLVAFFALTSKKSGTVHIGTGTGVAGARVGTGAVVGGPAR